MPIARRSLGAASLVAALNLPVLTLPAPNLPAPNLPGLSLPALSLVAAPAAAAAPRCDVSGFTARSQADLAKISVLDPGPLAPDQPALADVRLAVARGAVNSSGRPHRTVATGRYADARLLGIPLTDAAAVHRAPSRHPGPVGVDLADLDAGGPATVKLGKATATATWEDAYRCGRTGPLTRAATMLGGVSVLPTRALNDVSQSSRRTSLLRIGPTASTQSATDLVRLPGGQIGVRAGAGVALGDLSLFAGTPQEVSVKVITQPTLEVVAAADPRQSTVDHRPAVLEVHAGGKTVSVLKDAGADVSLSLLGETAQNRPAALAVRLSLGTARRDVNGRQVRAEASTVRVEVRLGRVRLLDVALGHLAVEACAPQRGRVAEPPVPTPVGSPAPVVTSDPVSRPSSPPSSPVSSPVSSLSSSPSEPLAASPSAPTGGGGGGAELALTGANVAAVGAGGAGLVVAGLVAMVLGRRRRDN